MTPALLFPILVVFPRLRLRAPALHVPDGGVEVQTGRGRGQAVVGERVAGQPVTLTSAAGHGQVEARGRGGRGGDVLEAEAEAASHGGCFGNWYRIAELHWVFFETCTFYFTASTKDSF